MCCNVTKVENDRLVPMFGCVCISVSDQSPSTKLCNKEDCRNQVVQFLTNPFLANFQNGHSPPLYLVGFADGVPRGEPMPPLYRGHMGFPFLGCPPVSPYPFAGGTMSILKIF